METNKGYLIRNYYVKISILLPYVQSKIENMKRMRSDNDTTADQIRCTHMAEPELLRLPPVSLPGHKVIWKRPMHRFTDVPKKLPEKYERICGLMDLCSALSKECGFRISECCVLLQGTHQLVYP